MSWKKAGNGTWNVASGQRVTGPDFACPAAELSLGLPGSYKVVKTYLNLQLLQHKISRLSFTVTTKKPGI